MDLFQAILLGIIEGFTEFLPVSSTGHLILASHLLNLKQTEFLKSFEIAIQSGAILSVVVLYGRQLVSNAKLLKQALIAFIPTGVIGFVLYKLVKTYLLGNSYVTLVALLLGGVGIIAAEYFLKKEKKTFEVKDLSIKRTFLIGIAQSISMIPGVSRSASTIIGGLFLGLNRKAAVEFSFILAIPTMVAATGYDLLKSYQTFSISDFQMLAIGFVTSFIVAIIAIKWFLRFVKTSNLIPFGIYRIAVALIFLLLI